MESEKRGDRPLREALEFAVGQARDYVVPSRQGIPMRGRRGLGRSHHGLVETSSEEVDVRMLSLVVQGTPEFWPRLAELVTASASDADVEAMTGMRHAAPTDHAGQVWQTLLSRLFAQYAARRPELDWDESLADALVRDWRGILRAAVVRYHALAPLDNLTSVSDGPLELAETVQLRAMTDNDRDTMWHHFGGNGTDLRLEMLDGWTHVLDLRWELSLKPPITDEPLRDLVADAVTSLRLHHPGVVRASFLFITTEPEDAVASLSFARPLLYKLAETRREHRIKTFVGEADQSPLQTMLDRVSAAREDRRMALVLRRLNSAYERPLSEDALVDLWVAFEALLIPESTTELRYRAALRIARLTGDSSDERETAFVAAKRSYDARSKVVHGGTPPADLDALTEKTRQLARVAIAQWLLTENASVDAIDRALLE